VKILVCCHPSDNPWSPTSTKSGIGGSEEAVISMAAELAAMGHEVVVLNSRAGASRNFNGVTYGSYLHLPPADRANVAIVWRYARLYRRFMQSLKIGKSYLWLHDAFDETRFFPHLSCYHKVMVLSQFHRSLYNMIEPEKFFITRNGIVSHHFEQPVRRDPRKVVYGSSYNRGLRILLESWGTIKRAVPAAKLSIFYGWQSFQRCNPQRYRVVRPYFESLMKQSGITHLGRIGHLAVAREYLSAGIWAYPASFPEVSCISAMKAQVGGAVPVVIPTGALQETVKFGYKTDRCYTDFADRQLPRRFINEWRDALIDYLRNPDRQESVRVPMMAQSRSAFSWRGVAEEWVGEFLS
jgi:glycosyltransferase involved in cell wall biosynthesis